MLCVVALPDSTRTVAPRRSLFFCGEAGAERGGGTISIRGETWTWLRGDLGAGLLLLVLVSFLVFGLARTPSDWWFEDDTWHLAFVRDHPNPIGYFTQKELIREVSVGLAVTPWFPFTFWLDRQIAPLSPMVAYLHSAFAFFLAALLLYRLLLRWLDRPHALGVAVLWVLLPSSIVTVEFLSTRHYLEGLIFSIVSFWMACLAGRSPGGEGRGYCWAAAVVYLLACTTKEVYVSTTWLLVVGSFVWYKRYGAVAGMFLCGLLYVLYRFWGIGPSMKSFNDSSLAVYHLFLARLPFMFTGNRGGYVLFALMLAAVVWLAWKRGLKRGPLLFFGANLAVMLVTILPVSVYITHAYDSLGTWYRLVFLVNTFLLTLFGWIVYRLGKPALSLGLAVLALVFIVNGALEATFRWDRWKAENYSDARFYLDHPDRLLFTRLSAPWFIYGVHQVYQPELPMHFLSWRVDNGTKKSYILRQTERFEEIWVKRAEAYRPDRALLRTLRENCLEDIHPLDKPRPQPMPEQP